MAEPNWPVPFAEFVDWALYDTDTGFYATSGHAGRRGDFITSPEVGPLFGAVVARALDTWWDELGEPTPFEVVDAGAGPGTLARSVLSAAPRCAAALRWVAVERSAAQRERHPDGIESRSDLPEFAHVIIANELLDNLAFDLLVYDGGWRKAWVGRDRDVFVELLRPATELPAALPMVAPHGSRVADQFAAARWVAAARSRLAPGGRLVVFDYATTTAAMAARPWRQWLRTYRAHERGSHYLRDVGQQDITVEVAIDQLPEPDAVRSQAHWLALHGIDELVAEGRRVWEERAGIGDLAALRGRSRVGEAEALTDPAGLGGYQVVEWAHSLLTALQ